MGIAAFTFGFMAALRLLGAPPSLDLVQSGNQMALVPRGCSSGASLPTGRVHHAVK